MKKLLWTLLILPFLTFANLPDIAVDQLELDLHNGQHGRLVKRWGKTVRLGRRWHRMLRAVPPKTSRPLYIFVEARENGIKTIEIDIRQGKKSLKYLKQPAVPSLKWYRIGPFNAKDLQPDFDICAGSNKKCQLYISRAVITTDKDWNASKKKFSADTAGALTIGKGRTGITAGPFVLIREKRFADEQSWLKMHWDENFLYADFTNFESILDPVANRLHEFKTAQKNQWKNDHVLLLIKRNGIMYDFLISGSGKLNDARLTGPEFYSNRDPRWNSGAKAAVSKGKGVWNASLEIPWKNIGGTPKKGETLTFQAQRRSNSASEVSTLFPTRTGAHDANDFGVLSFCDKVQEIKYSLPNFHPGKNSFALQNGEAVIRIRAGAKKAEIFRGSSFNIAHNGTIGFNWRFSDPATGLPVWISPEYLLSATARQLKFTGASAIRINGKSVTSDVLITNQLNKISLPDNFKGKLLVDNRQISIPGKEFTLASECSYMWPNWHAGELVIPAGGLQLLQFAPKGFPGKTVRDYTLKLDLPPGFKVECASGNYNYYKLSFTPDGTITFHTPIGFSGSLLAHQYLMVFVRAPSKPFSGTISYAVSSPKANIFEIPNSFKVKVVPAETGVRPKNFRILAWVGWERRLTDQKYLSVLVRELAKYGINEVHEIPNTTIAFSHRFNLKSWSWSLAPYVKAHPESALTRANGTRDKLLVCPQFIRKPEFTVWLEKQMPGWLKRAKNPPVVGWDFEHNYKNTPFSCYCKVCIKESDIASRNKMVAEYARIIRNALRKCDPRILFTVYSGYQSASTRENYCIDWKLFPGIADMVECGYGRPEKELAATQRVIGNTPLVTGAIIRPYERNNRAYPQQFTPAWLLRRAADATGGILLFEHAAFNGDSLNAIAQVSKVIARYEDFFRFGTRKKVVIPNWRADWVQLIEYKGKELLLLMNLGRQNLVFEKRTIAPGNIAVIER